MMVQLCWREVESECHWLNGWATPLERSSHEYHLYGVDVNGKHKE